MGHYTKKPVTIEAFCWTGGPDQGEDPIWVSDAIRDGVIQFVEAGFMAIQTTEGLVNASPGDWIIRGVEGEIYPCRDSVFAATYAAASREADASGAPALTRSEADDLVERSTAPRVTKEAIEAKVAGADYFRNGVLTLCIITMRSGFTFVGKSACVSPENYDQAAGERYAYDDAFRQIWAFEAYLLRERLDAAAAEPRVPRRASADPHP